MKGTPTSCIQHYAQQHNISVLENKLVDDYLYTLIDNKKSHYTSNKICSKNHQVFSITINIVGLCNYNNKRYYIDNITSLPYGHYSLRS